MAQDAKTRKTTILPRRCRYCRTIFVPETRRGNHARFCCDDHRKAYWRYGGLRFDKFKAQLIKELKRFVTEEIERCAPLAALIDPDSLKPGETEKEVRRIVREELARLLASLGQSTP